MSASDNGGDNQTMKTGDAQADALVDSVLAPMDKPGGASPANDNPAPKQRDPAMGGTGFLKGAGWMSTEPRGKK